MDFGDRKLVVSFAASRSPLKKILEKFRCDSKNSSIVGNPKVELWYRFYLNVKTGDRISL
jgi:hypothetical protein